MKLSSPKRSSVKRRRSTLPKRSSVKRRRSTLPKRSSVKRSSPDKINLIYLSKSNKPDKKFMVRINNKTIHFGAKGMSDYTIHKDTDRMHRYENRHKSRENWTKSGIETAGFWSKYILWNKPSFIASIKDTEKRFGIKIKFPI